MPAFNNVGWVGARRVRPTEAQLQQIAARDTGLYQVGMDVFWRAAGYFLLQFTVHTQANNNTKSSLALTARVPFKIVAVDVGCESAAGTAATADLEKNPSGTPDTFVTMSTGAVDIKTLAGDFVNLPVLAGSEDVEAGDELRLTVVGSSAGAVVGAQAIAHCFRL